MALRETKQGDLPAFVGARGGFTFDISKHGECRRTSIPGGTIWLQTDTSSTLKKVIAGVAEWQTRWIQNLTFEIPETR